GRHGWSGGWVPEFVLGSTTDPPQEAAILDIGPDDDGRPAVRVRTIPAISRQDETCGGALPIAAQDCDRIFKELRKTDACAELFGAERDRLARGSKCQNLIDEWWPALDPPASSAAATPDDVKCMQQDRAWRLLKCIRRDTPAAVPREPLDDPKIFDLVER